MTEPDIIRIDGVEYEECRECPGDKCADPTYVCIRPKRKQTGWICRGCSRWAPCVEISTHPAHPPGCTRPTDVTEGTHRWEKFYGKVVE